MSLRHSSCDCCGDVRIKMVKNGGRRMSEGGVREK